MKKIYSAFISSAFNSLRRERNEVINILLDFRVLPIGMEHFTVSTNGEFSDIEELIDDSDFFIMLMGESYGSCDENGVSWTEREYEYARVKNKPIVVIICDDLVKNLAKDRVELTEDQRKQVDLSNKISFARKVVDEFSIKTIISQFFHTYNFAKCIGWSRVEDIELDDKKMTQWCTDNRVFDISGNWYHVHLSEDDDNYIRIGNIKIEQNFSPNKFKELHMEGNNFNVDYYDSKEKILYEDRLKSSHFVGEYTLQENGEIFGIFNSKRTFKGEFNSFAVNKGIHRGIHDFTIDISCKDRNTVYFDGEFHDEAPSPKQGRIFLFRDMDERNKFLLKTRKGIIEVR